MKVEHEEKNNKGNFFVEQDGDWVAEMVYELQRSKMIIYHTEVADALKGKSVGMQLVKAGAEYARQNDLKIVPLCSFAKAVMHKDDAFKDVLA